ncbi:MAG: OmpA family protein [Gammaproteobacteria bacterium]
MLAGCSTTAVKPAVCIAVGGLAGAGAAAAANDDDEGAMVLSAVGGMLLGSLICKDPEPEPAPAPKPAPKPQPKPKPAPPPADSDGDGVIDADDACPGTPKGVRVDARGCPEIPDLTGIHFEHDKARLTPEAKGILDVGVAALERDPHVVVRIVGHTDSSGSASYNQALSERRAQAAADYLVARGIAASRLEVSGRGEQDPIAPNDTKQGRATNRRVELSAHAMK